MRCVLTQYRHVTDRQTDTHTHTHTHTQTHDDSICRASIASRGKNAMEHGADCFPDLARSADDAVVLAFTQLLCDLQQHLYTVFKKVVQLIFGHNFCECRPIVKIMCGQAWSPIFPAPDASI